MIRTRRLIAIFLAIVLLNGTTALACGPFTLEAVFVHTVHPAYPLERFAAGRIGVVQPSYARSYLYTAYRYLSGSTFTPGEQKALVSLWRHRLTFHSDEGDSDWTKVWLDARKQVSGAQSLELIDIYRAREKPNEYESYVNCNKDAFEIAAATLNQRIAKYGASSPEIQNWLQAQDQVFSNCTSGKSIPEPAPSGADAVLRADRAYQIAAANFYAADFDEARKQFETIAADNTSPWQRTAQFLVARTLIRKGGLGLAEQKQESLSAAENALKKILADKSFSDLHPSATRLLNLVRLRFRPNERMRELAQTLLARNENANLKQDLWDYTVLLDQHLEGDEKKSVEPLRGDDLSDWISTFQSEYAATFDHALERWQTTRSVPWLIAALSGAEGKHARAGELIAEAAKVKPNTPAFASAQFHAVRLLMDSGKNDEARTLLDQLLKTHRDQFDAASLNLLTSKRMLVANTLADFLTYAPRVPVTLSWNDDGRELPVDDDEIDAEMKALKDQPRFDYDAGVALNRKMPLSVLKEAAKNNSLPAPLRRDLVQAVWLRAVILGDTRTADELAPIVRQSIPELSTLLDAYLSATTPQAKKFSAIYAWLKFPGLEPVVDFGVGRRAPLQSQDSYRDNWWCGNAYYVPAEEKENEVTGPPSFTSNNEHELLFLSFAEKETAKQQWTTLGALGAAPNYISQNVVQWANRTPADPRVPEALHLAVMTTRYGCTDKNSGRWSKAAFDVLHRKYPNSTWAKQTPYWFNN
jgi:tetratricopeptide (TPR) repeat protein